MSFIERFFGYFSDGPGDAPSQIWDGLGQGAFEDWRHYAWMVLVIILSIAAYQFARRKPKIAKIVLLSVASALFLVRFVHQTYRGMSGVEVPWYSAFPWHMCTVLTFVLPLVIVFDIKALKQSVYVLSIMGGLLRSLLGIISLIYFFLSPRLKESVLIPYSLSYPSWKLVSVIST